MTNNRRTEKTEKQPSSNGRLADDITLAKLMTLAGPRSVIPLDTQLRVHNAVRGEWIRATRMPRAVRWVAPFALAASVVLAVALLIQPSDLRTQSIGSIARVAGAPASAGVLVGDSVNVGDILDTATGQGLSVVLRDDVSLRVAANSMLRVDSSNEFSLLAGQIYVDSGSAVYRRRHLTIHTVNGSATDIGTQFSVRFDGMEMSVAVREGTVDIQNSHSTYTAEAGQRIHLQRGTDTRIDRVDIVGPEWDWATSLAPAYDIESSSLMDFLQWVARETGKELVFASDEVRMATMGSRLHGSVADYKPMDALESVLKTTDFKVEVDDRTISISK